MRNKLIVLVILSLIIVGCDDDGGFLGIGGANLPGDTVICSPPQSNNAKITPRIPTVSCSPAAPCIADHTVSSQVNLERTNWTAPGSQETESDVPNGTFNYDTAGSKTWTSTICTSKAEDDINNECCRTKTGSFTIVDP